MKVLALFLALLCVFSVTAPAAENVDRIVATVNDEPVLASDVEDAAYAEALMQGRPVTEVKEADYKAAMERLIDRTLIRQQMSAMAVPLDQQVNAQIAQLRSALPGTESDTGWQQILASYGIDEAKLRKMLTEQIQLMQFIDTRLRPTARVSRSEVDAYYKEKLVPELESKGAEVEPLEKVQSHIWEILRQEKIDAQLTTWLADLRSQGQVRILQPPVETATGTGSIRKGMFFSILERR